MTNPITAVSPMLIDLFIQSLLLLSYLWKISVSNIIVNVLKKIKSAEVNVASARKVTRVTTASILSARVLVCSASAPHQILALV